MAHLKEIFTCQDSDDFKIQVVYSVLVWHFQETCGLNSSKGFVIYVF